MGRAYRFKLIFITMTHKVYNKCLYTWMRDIDTHVERIEVYDGTTFYPTKDSEEWNEDTITFEYRQMYTNSTLPVQRFRITIHRKDIKQIVMWKIINILIEDARIGIKNRSWMMTVRLIRQA